MNAKEARKKAWQFNTNADNSQYALVKKVIDEQASSGNYSCYYYDSLRQDVKTRLENEGYKISEHFDQRDGTTVTITW